MLGLKRGIVELAPHDASWATAFAKERERLEGALPAGTSIEHVGSTAVTGLVAKPIIDIALGLSDDAERDAAFSGLEGLGYEYRGDAGPDGGHVFVLESELGVRTHHVHLVELDDPQWVTYLRFRDLLRRREEAREAYQQEKLTLAARYPTDRLAYTTAKDEIVKRLLAEALP